jgi:hypothetical protein
MHTLAIIVLAIGSCAAYYGGGYDTRNLIVREEPSDDMEG